MGWTATAPPFGLHTTVADAAALLAVGTAYWLQIRLQARRELVAWERQARLIPDPLLRRLALQKLTGERLNPEAASFFAVLAPRAQRPSLVKLIVAYQVLYDYLDAVNEQPGDTALRNGLQLHQALIDGVSHRPACHDYYRHNSRRDDGGYIATLVKASQYLAQRLPSARHIAPVITRAAERCAQGQSHNHATVSEGNQTFVDWSRGQGRASSSYEWWELAAAGISCLGIHALFAHSARCLASRAGAERLDAAYFPSICAISALLDSLADYHADCKTANHSFVAHYHHADAAAKRFVQIVADAKHRITRLPGHRRHATILDGIVAYYLSSSTVAAGFPSATVRALTHQGGVRLEVMRSVMRIRRYWHEHRQ